MLASPANPEGGAGGRLTSAASRPLQGPRRAPEREAARRAGPAGPGPEAAAAAMGERARPRGPGEARGSFSASARR